LLCNLKADFALAAPSPRTFYVSPSGSDKNPGTADKPFASPGYASKLLQPGDTLIVKKGVYFMSEYWDDMITPEASGTPGAWITIRGEDPNDRPALVGRNNLIAAVELGGKSFIRVENFEITSMLDDPYSGGFRGGVEAGGSAGGAPSGHIELRNLYIHHVEEAAINCAGDFTDSLIEGCTISRTAGSAINAPDSAGGKGWQRVVIRNTNVEYVGWYWQGRDQFSEWDRPDGFGIEESEGPVEISHCTFSHGRGDGVDSKSRNTYVHHTVIANNRCDGLKLWGGGTRVENVLIYGCGDGDPDNGPWASIVVDSIEPGDFEFVNVTVDDNVQRGNYPVYMQYDLHAPINVRFRNCIIAHGYSTIYLGPAVAPVFDHCLLYRSGDPSLPVVEANGREYLPSELDLLGFGNICAEPEFAMRGWGTPGDYHLLPGSPGIDAGSVGGVAQVPADDLEGTPRPQGAGPDIGAYEEAG